MSAEHILDETVTQRLKAGLMVEQRRITIEALAELPIQEGSAVVRDALKDISMEFVYMLGPHAQHHLGELIDKFEIDESS